MKSLFDVPLRITEERGKVLTSEFGPTLITVHPSSLLRLPDPEQFEPQFERYVADLRQITRIANCPEIQGLGRDEQVVAPSPNE